LPLFVNTLFRVFFIKKQTKCIRIGQIRSLNEANNNIKKTVDNKALPTTRAANPRKGSTARVCVSASVGSNGIFEKRRVKVWESMDYMVTLGNINQNCMQTKIKTLTFEQIFQVMPNDWLISKDATLLIDNGDLEWAYRLGLLSPHPMERSAERASTDWRGAKGVGEDGFRVVAIQERLSARRDGGGLPHAAFRNCDCHPDLKKKAIMQLSCIIAFFCLTVI
jgi:hypothetical protein